MDFVADILPLVLKGISIANALLDADNIAGAKRAWVSISSILKPPETVTQADLDLVETELDALLDEFNVELPSAT